MYILWLIRRCVGSLGFSSIWVTRRILFRFR